MAATASTGVPPNINGANGTNLDYEAIVIGAGIAGVRMLYELRRRGISARVFESGSNVGGTWYWNRYPGARTDSESWIYIFTFLEEIGMDWDWKERFPTQPEVERYYNAVTDHLNLRKDITFNTRIASAHRDEDKNLWRVTTSQGDQYTYTFLVTATGVLATPLKPDFRGLDSYQGEWYMTGLWPRHKVSYAGKRVAVVGTGASAVQVIPTVAHTAKTVTVFQRTPNFVLPARNHPVTEDQMIAIKANYGKHINNARTSAFGMDFVDSTRTMADTKDDAEFQRVLENGWEVGGFRFIFETFADMLTNPECNAAAGEFVRNKIRAIVKDEKTAELLCPYYTILSKRPPLGHFYYETFNRENVKLVDVKNDPIQEITPSGLRTGTAEYEFDLIIFAIGFDAITGTLAQIDLRGSDNQVLSEQLNKKMATAYGITVAGFPNLFMLAGPQSPFANLPVVCDNTTNWIGQTIAYMRENGHGKIDTRPEVGEKWSEHVNEVFEGTVLKQGAKDTMSWYVGANVAGKKVQPMFYFGGVAPYFAHCKKEIDDGFPGYEFSRPVQVVV